MSTQAALIRVADSLIPLPPEAFPKNLALTPREDNPEQLFPILAYDGEDILPTPWGYRSYFATNSKLLRNSVARLLPNVKCENVFWYQSVQLDNVLVALASDGIYVTNTDIESDWIKVVDLSALDTDPALRRQWSHCTINNITYMYLQGGTKFYSLVDVARYAEAATPSVITGATVAQVAQHWNVGVLSYTPTFLNMSGQIGLFKAGNRLGFWDSDGSVSWSSALYVEDFTPSVTTLAGFSKFSDVVGSITVIAQHGDGFIIYATRSIVGVTNNVSEKSKFSGRAILSKVGLLFDRQLAVAQPDSLHYALTSAGLHTITNFVAEPIAADIMDGLIEANDYLALDYVDGRYLFINTLNGWEGSVIDFEGVTNLDSDGNAYKFPAVNYPNPTDASALLDSYLTGRNELIQNAFDEFEPIDSPAAIQEPGRALVPCFNIKTFESNWANNTFAPIKTGTELLDSKIKLGVTYLLDELYNEAIITVNSITTDTNLPGNFAGQEAMNLINQGMTKFNAQITYQNAWFAANQTPYSVNKSVFSAPPDNWDGETIEVQWEKKLIERREYPFHLDSRDIKAEANKCRLHLYCDKTRLAEYNVYFEGVEKFEAGKVPFFINGATLSASYFSNWPEQPQLTYPKTYLLLPYDVQLESEFRSRYAQVAGFSFAGLVISSGEVVSPDYASWVLATYPELVIGEHKTAFITLMDLMNTKAIGDTTGLYVRVAEDLNPYIFSTGQYYGAAAWYESVDGAFFVPDTTFPSWYTDGNANEGWVAQGDFVANIGPFLLGANWTAPQKAPILATNTGSPVYTLQGVISIERDLPPNFPGKYTIYDMEISGFGYYPSGGFSFRKTHNRNSSSSCPVPLTGWGTSLPTNLTPEFPDYNINSEVKPPYRWDYPDRIPLPPNYWLTKKGSASPLFPIFTRSLIYDQKLEKWGISSQPFRAIATLAPVNRTDKTIAPVHDYGMLAAYLNTDGSVSILRPGNANSEICYGKIGRYRLGKSTIAYLKCHFKEPFTGSLIVEASEDGRTIAKDLTKAANFSGVLSALFPFTMVGDWFNIKIRGDFALSHIECYIEGRSRR